MNKHLCYAKYLKRFIKYIHFYVNRCGFHIVEFFNKHHPDPNEIDSMDEEINSQFRDGMFRFQKKID